MPANRCQSRTGPQLGEPFLAQLLPRAIDRNVRHAERMSQLRLRDRQAARVVLRKAGVPGPGSKAP
jgi:hypothetical protein